ncbi:hypothetical protein Bca101_060817 [Brassica carinata]
MTTFGISVLCLDRLRLGQPQMEFLEDCGKRLWEESLVDRLRSFSSKRPLLQTAGNLKNSKELLSVDLVFVDQHVTILALIQGSIGTFLVNCGNKTTSNNETQAIQCVMVTIRFDNYIRNERHRLWSLKVLLPQT